MKCAQTLPPEHERSFISKGTPFCQFHSKGRVLFVYLSSPAARAWLRGWEARFKSAVLAADTVPDQLLDQTDFRQ